MKKNNLQGFTLVEMLITVGVFAIVSVVTSSIFINVNNLQQQTGNLQRLQNEGRYLLEKIAKEIRSRELDYGLIGFPNGGLTDKLDFKVDELGDLMSIRFDNQNKIILISINGSEEKLNSDQVEIKDLKFKVYPSTNPFNYATTSSEVMQPRVTIYLKLSNKGVSEKYLKNLNLQTTISSKIYK